MSRNAFLVTLLATFFAVGLFNRDPELDLRVARMFFNNGFMGASDEARAARSFF